MEARSQQRQISSFDKYTGRKGFSMCRRCGCGACGTRSTRRCCMSPTRLTPLEAMTMTQASVRRICTHLHGISRNASMSGPTRNECAILMLTCRAEQDIDLRASAGRQQRCRAECAVGRAKTDCLFGTLPSCASSFGIWNHYLAGQNTLHRTCMHPDEFGGCAAAFLSSAFFRTEI